ncbi:PQQ-binding-like beta-propeller repeat protein [Catellatospora bangladeshensis]|nr:PQQ-binding-like beta-propeller repeat protein [Catellatospora bangladeshensis]
MIFQVRWRHSVHQRAYETRSAVAGERVVVHERSSRLIGLDVRDGGVRWDAPGCRWPGALTIAGGRCLAIAQWQPHPWLLCFEVIAGEQLWRAELPPTTGHLAVAGGAAVVGGWRGYTPLGAHDLGTGSLLWRTPERVAVETPYAVDGHVLVAETGTGRIRRIDARTGGDIAAWRLPEPVLGVDSGPVFLPLDADRVLIRGVSRAVWVLCLPTGEIDRLPGVPEDTGAVRVAGGLVWCDTGEGQVALEPGTAAPWARVPLYGRLVGAVAVESGYVLASDQGKLVAVDPGGAVLGQATVDRRIGALHVTGRDRVLVMGKSELLAVDLRA